jgi:HD-like signal output (HDOD) protein
MKYSPGRGSATAVLEPYVGADAFNDFGMSGVEKATRSEAESVQVPWWAPEGVTATEPIWVEPVELSGEARALEQRLISKFDGHDLQMPPMPRVAERVLATLRDRECGMVEVAKELGEDQVSAANVLRLANSPLYRGTYDVTTLQGAVTRLGAQVIKTLMLHQSLRSITFPKKSGAHELAKALWYRSLAAGSVMRSLAPLVGMDEEDAFTLGLLHDIGNVIVLRSTCDQEAVTHSWIEADTFEYLCFETHQEFGELIANQWQLPDSLRAVIVDHHRAPGPNDPLRTERRLIILTDMICQMLGYAPWREYDLLQTDVVRKLGLTEDRRFHKALQGLPGQIEETLASLD